jgi:hypothetical protein
MKKIILIPFILLFGCTKPELAVPELKINKDFFSVSENGIKNGDVINFNLITSGIYTITMIDTTINQVVSRERFTGKTGPNSIKIYTNSLPTKYLSVVLKDQNNNQVGKTKIIIN